MSTETTAKDMALRAQRVAILATFFETIDDRTERKRIIMAMYEARLLSPAATETLIEFFGLEAA